MSYIDRHNFDAFQILIILMAVVYNLSAPSFRHVIDMKQGSEAGRSKLEYVDKGFHNLGRRAEAAICDEVRRMESSKNSTDSGGSLLHNTSEPVKWTAQRPV